MQELSKRAALRGVPTSSFALQAFLPDHHSRKVMR